MKIVAKSKLRTQNNSARVPGRAAVHMRGTVIVIFVLAFSAWLLPAESHKDVRILRRATRTHPMGAPIRLRAIRAPGTSEARGRRARSSIGSLALPPGAVRAPVPDTSLTMCARSSAAVRMIPPTCSGRRSRRPRPKTGRSGVVANARRTYERNACGLRAGESFCPRRLRDGVEARRSERWEEGIG